LDSLSSGFPALEQNLAAVLPRIGRHTKGKGIMEVQGREIWIRGKLVRIAHIDGEGYQFLEDPVAALGAIRKCGERIDIFTFIQRLSDLTPRYEYPLEWDNMAVLPVSSFEDWMKNQIDFKVRNKVRKAEKNGVQVREVAFDDALVKGISSIYNESTIRQGKRFWHYGKDLDAVRSMNATFMDQSIFIGAYFQDQLIGFVKLVRDEESCQAGLMQIISMIEHRDKAPTNALIAQAVRSCAQRGITYLWYANFSYGKKQHDSLADFKRHNGFQKVELPRYYVPVTVTGRIALRLGLHHSAADWIPESLASRYRKLRSLWYAKRTAGAEGV